VAGELEFQSTLPRESEREPPRLTSGDELFQSTLPRESEHHRRRGGYRLHGFNPRSRARANISVTRTGSTKMVSIHAPARERTPVAQAGYRLSKVSIHAPARERTETDYPTSGDRGVSIHAPARERTRNGRHLRRHAGVSIHAPARERTFAVRQAADDSVSVSIHAPARERTSTDRSGDRLADVSIHAPARERTLQESFSARLTLFQSTLPRESEPSSSSFSAV